MMKKIKLHGANYCVDDFVGLGQFFCIEGEKEAENEYQPRKDCETDCR
jgi:hypothetical protein